MRLRPGEKTARAVNPNSGITVAYRNKMIALLREMARSYEHWLRATYRANPPAMMAQDAMPADELARTLKRMGLHWSRRYDQAAPKLAEFFSKQAHRQSEAALRMILKDSGIAVQFKMTRELRDIMKATVSENVSLIKSIQQQYHGQVEGLVMRSVTEGRDLKTLTDELQERFGISERKAKFIALDQNNKATSAIQRERQLSVNIAKGVWMHSHAGKEPRPTHLANDGNVFDLKLGWYDPDPKVRKRIWPGILARCRCTWRPVVKGFS